MKVECGQFTIMRWVIGRGRASSEGDRLLALILGKYISDPLAEGAYASVATLAALVDKSERNVRHALHRLTAASGPFERRWSKYKNGRMGWAYYIRLTEVASVTGDAGDQGARGTPAALTVVASVTTPWSAASHEESMGRVHGRVRENGSAPVGAPLPGAIPSLLSIVGDGRQDTWESRARALATDATREPVTVQGIARRLSQFEADYLRSGLTFADYLCRKGIPEDVADESGLTSRCAQFVTNESRDAIAQGR